MRTLRYAESFEMTYKATVTLHTVLFQRPRRALALYPRLNGPLLPPVSMFLMNIKVKVLKDRLSVTSLGILLNDRHYYQVIGTFVRTKDPQLRSNFG